MCGQGSCLLRAPPRSTQGPFGMGLTCQEPSRLPTEPSPWIWPRSPAFEDIVGWGREGMVVCSKGGGATGSPAAGKAKGFHTKNS